MRGCAPEISFFPPDELLRAKSERCNDRATRIQACKKPIGQNAYCKLANAFASEAGRVMAAAQRVMAAAHTVMLCTSQYMQSCKCMRVL